MNKMQKTKFRKAVLLKKLQVKAALSHGAHDKWSIWNDEFIL